MRALPFLLPLLVISATAAAAAPPPVVRWHLATPGWGEPAVDADAAYFLTRAHEVVALDRTSGTLRWRTSTDGDGEVPVGSVVRLGGSRVITGDGAIVAFDRATGRRSWTYRPPDGDSPGVFLGATTPDLVLAGSVAGRLYAVDLDSGRLRWRRDVATGERRAVFAPVHTGAAVVATYTTFDGPLTGGVVAFDLRGRRMWTRKLGTGVGAAGPPVVLGRSIAVAMTDGRVAVLDAATGRRRWTIDAAASRASGPRPRRDIRALAASGGVLAISSLAGDVRAYDVRTRRQRWRYAGGPADAVVLRMAADASHVYLPYSDGTLLALGLCDGLEAWRASGDDDSYDWPPSSDGNRVFAARSRSVAALGDESPAVAAGCDPR
jgi:outer membrane protein assembly factor BamB